MKKRSVLFLVMLLMACLAAHAGAEASKDAKVDRFLGTWENDEYRMYIRLEDEEVYSRLTHTDSNYSWEFDRCWYDADEDQLCCPNCVRYRMYIDWDTMELVQDDWSLSDMCFTYFAFAEDEDTLIGCDIPHIDETLTFRRVNDEEYFDF